jgi:PAS domain S-box-containing protein
MTKETTGRILVVDDTTANLQLLTKLLTGHGYAVYPASDGELALEFVRTTLPDLILLDIRMPGMDGFEVCRRLKEDERTRDIPVIFISILEDERDKVAGFRQGAVDYITKPFQPEEILVRIQTHLRLRELTERLELKVAERTCELASMNRVLHEEIRDRIRAEESLRRLNRELRAISDCNQVLVRAEDEQTLLSEICRIVCDGAGYRMAFVGRAENDRAKSVWPVAWAGVEEGYLTEARLTWADTERGRGPAGAAIRNGSTDCSQDIATDPRMAPWRDNALQRGYRSTIALPLKDENAHVFGVFLIYSPEPNAFTPDEIRLMEELAGDLTFGIQALRNRNARRESERSVALLSFALNNVREAAFLIDEQGRFHYVNEESCRVLGYSRDELLALGVADVDLDFPLERWPEHWAELKNRHSLIFEGRHKAKDGRIFPVELSANYLGYDGQGYNLALAREITGRKQSVHLTQARLRMLETAYTAGITLDDTLRAMLDEIEAQTGSRIGFYHFMEEDQQTISLQNWSTNTVATMCTSEGKNQHYPVTEAGIWADCVRERRPVIHNDYASLPNRRGMPDGHATVVRELVVPIFRGSLIVAIIGVGNKPEEYNENDVQIASLLGDFSWEIVIRKRAEEELRLLNAELENRVNQRTAELEARNADLQKMNKVFVGRELKMVELKERIRELEGRAS